MRDVFRLLTTLIIWGAFTAVVGVTLTSPTGPIADAGGIELVGIIALMALVAMGMTRAVWDDGFSRPARRADELISGKRKRSDSARLARLLEQLDDETVRDLEVLLLAQRSDARDADPSAADER